VTCRGVYPANFGDATTIRCRFMGYWAWARISCRARRHRYRSTDGTISIDRSATFPAYTAEIDKGRLKMHDAK